MNGLTGADLNLRWWWYLMMGVANSFRLSYSTFLTYNSSQPEEMFTATSSVGSFMLSLVIIVCYDSSLSLVFFSCAASLITASLLGRKILKALEKRYS